MELAVERLLAKPAQRRAERHRRIAFSGNRISAVAPGKPGEGAGLLALPALTNAHDHARAVKPVALGALELPLELWLAAIVGAPRVDPYLIGAVAFGRSALGGAGSVMCHYVRPQGGMSMVDEAREIARAAQDVGVRIAFAPSLRDRNAIAYGEDERVLPLVEEKDRAAVRSRLSPKPLPPAEQVALVEEIGRAIESDLVTVQFGPAAVQWCSHALLSAIAERSAATGRRVHMHLLETRYQREWADREYPQGMLKFLDSIGLLSPRLSVAHAVWARPAELELLAERGVTISVNNSSNTLMQAACDGGRRAVTGIDEPAALEPGRLADVLVLDYAALARDVIAEQLDELPLVLARATSRHIKALYVAGRQVLSEGRLTGIELAALEAQLVAQLRSGLADFNEWQRTVLRMRAGLTRFYATGMHCS